jgi:hypothetical protein
MSKSTKEATVINNALTSDNGDSVRKHMRVNVILTFNTYDKYGDSQEIFDVTIPVSRNDSDAVSFVMSKLFKRIEGKCEQLGRRKQELIKISTAADWSVFESVTHKKSLPELGHICKWHFGIGRKRLDIMEKCAMAEYQFGTDADLSSEEQWFEDHIAKVLASQTRSTQSNAV